MIVYKDFDEYSKSKHDSPNTKIVEAGCYINLALCSEIRFSRSSWACLSNPPTITFFHSGTSTTWTFYPDYSKDDDFQEYENMKECIIAWIDHSGDMSMKDQNIDMSK